MEIPHHSTPNYESKTILMMAGGTGGHVYPALAVAQYLHQAGATIHWLGNQEGFEGKKVADYGFELHDIAVRGLRGNGLLGWTKAPLMVSKAIWRAKSVLSAIQPDLVIGMGGFAAGPGGVAAKLASIPLVIHEQNAVMGMTNRILSRIADKVLLADERAASAVNQSEKVIVVGNPVRAEIVQLPAPEQRFDRQRQCGKLLVIGGSQGAKAINECVPAALALLAENDRPQVLHQTGEKTFVQTRKQYEQLAVEAQVLPYIDDMAGAYEESDWVIARSGALSVAEIATVGLSAVFVPFPHAVDDHQSANAQGLVDIGAATRIAQAQLTPTRLAEVIKAHNDLDYAHQRGITARKLSHANALANIIQAIEGYL